LTLKVRPARSRPGMSSARNVTDIPGRAQTSSLVAFLSFPFLLIINAPSAPNEPAAITNPPTTCMVLLFIGFFFLITIESAVEGKALVPAGSAHRYSHKGSRRAEIVGKPLSDFSAFIGV